MDIAELCCHFADMDADAYILIWGRFFIDKKHTFHCCELNTLLSIIKMIS